MIKIKYLDECLAKMVKVKKGDLIDLRVSWVEVNGRRYDSIAMEVDYKAGDIVKIGFGVAMELPNGYKGCIYPRSSTFKNYGLILTNGVGQVDNIYCGDEDEWCGMFYALRDGIIGHNERVAQFDISPVYIKEHELKEVELLGNGNRGGYGTTGVK